LFVGVTGLLADDSGPVPMVLVAVTRNVYDVPLVRPDTVQVVAGALTVQPVLEGVELTV
jgi:hypothetical protein